MWFSFKRFITVFFEGFVPLTNGCWGYTDLSSDLKLCFRVYGVFEVFDGGESALFELLFGEFWGNPGHELY